MRKIVYAALGGAFVVAAAPAASTDWLQFGFDASHSGTNPAEKLLTKQNVQYLRPMYSKTLPGTAEGAPVFLAGVTTPSGTKDVLYLTLSDGTLLALDAASGATLWSKFASGSDPCVIDNHVDKPCVTASSPALDPNRQFVYNYAIDGYVHKYHVGDGSEVTTGGWPELASLKPDVEQVSAALSFATAHNGKTYLYVTTSGASWLPEDSGDYQGHITAINLSTGTQITFNMVCSDQGSVHFVKNDPNPPVGTTPDCLQETMTAPGDPGPLPTGDAGIWGRAATIYDPVNDEIYLTTGNGLFGFDANTNGHNWSDSIVALPAALDTARTVPLDSYTPTNYVNLMYYDTDLGSTSVVLAPAPAGSSKTHIGIQSGKDGALRIIDLDNMSGAIPRGPGNPGGEAFSGNVPQGNEVKTQPLVWTDSSSGISYVIVTNNFGIAAIQLSTDAAHNPTLQYHSPVWMHTGNAAPSSTTTGGTSPVIANNVLYYAGGSGVQALDPATGNTLWSDAAMGTANASTTSSFHKQSVIVVNNRVYVFDKHATLWAYQGDEIFPDGFQ